MNLVLCNDFPVPDDKDKGWTDKDVVTMVKLPALMNKLKEMSTNTPLNSEVKHSKRPRNDIPDNKNHPVLITLDYDLASIL